MFKKRLFISIFLLLLTACADATQPAPDYATVRPLEFGGQLMLPGGEMLNGRDFIYFFQKADYILLGESHTNMTDHMSQAAILEKLAKQRLRPVLALEMLDVEAQPVLDRFNAGGMSLDELEQALEWQKNVGYAFDLYRPVLETAVRCKIPLYALNIPRRVVRDARLKGLEGVAEADRKYIPAAYMPASEAQQIKLRQFFRQHMAQAGQMPVAPAAQPADHKQIESNASATERVESKAAESKIVPAKSVPAKAVPPAAKNGTARQVATARKRLPPEQTSPAPKNGAPQAASSNNDVRHLEQQQIINGFVRAQSLWDSAMATRAMELHKALQRPVVIIAGTGHVEYGWGIALRLRAQEPEARVICVMPWRAPMETVFAANETSPLLAPEQHTDAIPTPDLGDAYYYSSAAPIGKSGLGMVTWAAPSDKGAAVAVLAVDADSAAQKAGILPGDIILKIGGRTVADNAEFYYLLAQLEAYQSQVKMLLLRGQEQKEIILQHN